MSKKKSPHKQVTKVIDYKVAFGTDEGKRVLYDILKVCGMLTSSFDYEEPEALSMAYREGQRNVALYIFNKLKTDVHALTKFIEEQEEQHD